MAALQHALSTITRLPFEPLVTAPLLLVLLKGPENVREKLIGLLKTTPGLRNIELNTVISVLKGLLAYGVVSYTNSFFNNFALNRFRLTKDGTSWNWPNEIVLITGGSSGFGKLMTEKLASKVKKVVVLDVQSPPKEFENSMSCYSSSIKRLILIKTFRPKNRLL